MSDYFYEVFPHDIYPEIEQKKQRPYIQVVTLINDVRFAIPLRSNINHPHVLWTDKKNKCGLDFSKAVVIVEDKYIDLSKKPYIRVNEFNSLRGKDYRIKQKMIKYIEKYKEAKGKNDDLNRSLVDKSTLQYFEQYI